CVRISGEVIENIAEFILCHIRQGVRVAHQTGTLCDIRGTTVDIRIGTVTEIRGSGVSEVQHLVSVGVVTDGTVRVTGIYRLDTGIHLGKSKDIQRNERPSIVCTRFLDSVEETHVIAQFQSVVYLRIQVQTRTKTPQRRVYHIRRIAQITQ